MLGVNRHKGNREKVSLLHQCGHINSHHWSIPDCIEASLNLIPTSLLPPQITLTLKRYTKIIQSTQPFILHQILLQWNTISILQTQMLWGACFCMSWLYRLAQQCVYFIEMTTLLKLTDSLWGREELTKPTCIASSMVYHKHKSANLSNDTSFSKKERKKTTLYNT